jgi:hypothetical protein
MAGKIPFPGNGDSRRNTSTGADLLWQHHVGGRGSLLAVLSQLIDLPFVRLKLK